MTRLMIEYDFGQDDTDSLYDLVTVLGCLHLMTSVIARCVQFHKSHDKTVEDDSTMVKEENSEDHSVVLKPPEEIRKEETEEAENHPPDYHDISSLLSKFKKRDSPAESKEEKNKNHVDFIERI